MSISHCQYCGLPADACVRVEALNYSRALQASTGYWEFSVASCLAHAGSAAVREPFTHCVETGATLDVCACFWCADKRREARVFERAEVAK